MILSGGGGGLSRKFTLGVVTVAASAVNCDCFFRVDVTEVTRSRVPNPLFITCTRTVLHINQKNKKISKRK